MERFRGCTVLKSTLGCRQMRQVYLVVVSFLSLAQPGSAALLPPGQPDWETYVDEQYGTRVEYPTWFSVSDGQPEMGTGERRITPDGRAEIEMYSLPNPGHDAPSEYLAKTLRLSPVAIHYKRVTGRFFVLSAIRGGKIRYTRCNFSNTGGGTIHCVYLGYPPAEKRVWDDIVTRVSFSLRP
jgi:hypothetical protein